ncbi:hypothetical protein F2Q69_00024978 [Brassica cretica]|uniref:MATH domain-containing protein n=1 Tax=Brassica cretica TaxID=69181 RepID=A0A8S9Q8F7_BRACR|nr:hypothetical protein F2Q69_00024978 [Brassica cretica]
MVVSWNSIPVYRLLQGEPYESSIFEAAGYKWRLVLHVGNAGYISLYLRIEEAESIPYGLEVNVDLKLFVHVPKLDKYLTVTGKLMADSEIMRFVRELHIEVQMIYGAVRFNAEKKELGFEQLIDLASFENTNEGPVYRLLQGEPYESSIFEAAGYKWRLVLHVGNAGYISLYLRIEEAESIPYGLEVNVDLKLFVHVPKLDKYLTVTDGAVRFNAEKKELGFEQLIDLASFENTNEGYIVQDTCSFGVEIFIVKPAKVQQKVTFVSNPPRNVFTWMIPHFSDMEDKFYYSNDFLVGDRYWKLGLNPKGGSALPIYLYAQGFRPDAVATNTWGAVNLRLKNQRSTNHREIYSAAWYPIRSDYGVGVNSIISLADLHYASKGYLVNDAIIFEAEMVKVTVTNIVSV